MTKRTIFFLKFMLLAGALLVGFVNASLQAQPVLSPKNIALGGGGTTYLTGYESTLWNPANLAIHDQPGTFHFGLGQAGILHDPLLSKSEIVEQYLNYTDTLFPYRAGTAAITPNERLTIVDDNYPADHLLSQHHTRSDLILGGVHWQRENHAWSVVARARMGSRIEVGRGWYSEEFIAAGNREVRDFTLNHQKNHLYELSVGYAQEFTFINGLIPRLSKLYVGIAPKMILAGPSTSATYEAQYIRFSNTTPILYASDFSYHSTGRYSTITSDYLATGDPQQAVNSTLSRTYSFQNTGYGLGFDFGLTYMLPLGSTLPKASQGTKSLRFSLSVNDLGMVRYYKNPLTLSSAADTVQIGQQAPSESAFMGAAGQYLFYFNSAEAVPNPILGAENRDAEDYFALLPTTLNAGLLIDFNRLKVMGDLTLGLDNTAFSNTKLAIKLGLEARPLQQLPLRFGTRLAAGMPTHIGMGTGIETRNWDLNIGTQIILRSSVFTSDFVGAAFAGLQFHL